MVQPHYYTPDMVREMPEDGNRYETVHGELLVSPAPHYRHQFVLRALFRVLDPYCVATGVGETLWSPADISLTSDSLVQPDLFVVPPSAEAAPAWKDLGRPILIIEALSPSTARVDRFTKRLHYQRAGVPTYWILDTRERFVEVWTPTALTPDIERVTLVWAPAGASVPLQISLTELFA